MITKTGSWRIRRKRVSIVITISSDFNLLTNSFIDFEVAEIDGQKDVVMKEMHKEMETKRSLEKDKRNEQLISETRQKVLNWLSSEDFEETHERHFQRRFEGTGQWLLDDSHFINWRDEVQSSLLWCYGARKSQLYACV